MGSSLQPFFSLSVFTLLVKRKCDYLALARAGSAARHVLCFASVRRSAELAPFGPADRLEKGPERRPPAMVIQVAAESAAEGHS
jgi:hypothetical protein